MQDSRLLPLAVVSLIAVFLTTRAYGTRRKRSIQSVLAKARRVASELTDFRRDELAKVARRIASNGKGVLAGDESVKTIGKRLVKAGLANTTETRRAYREVLFSHPDLGQHLSGAILHEETLGQKHSDGRSFVKVLSEKKILVGVKVDRGLRTLPPDQIETDTLGLDDLAKRCVAYKSAGAQFAKWRAVIRIDSALNLPTDHAIQLNAAQLALYAAISQAAGLVPIIEPELLIEGSHTAAVFAAETERVLAEVFSALFAAGVYLEGTLLKTQMIMAGVDATTKHTQKELVDLTLASLRRRVPPAVPGVLFLSGGQTEEEATSNLNAIACAAREDVHSYPWALTFSFGRSLQASVLTAFAAGNTTEAVRVAGALAAANAAAQCGKYAGPHPSTLGSIQLHETNRGW